MMNTITIAGAPFSGASPTSDAKTGTRPRVHDIPRAVDGSADATARGELGRGREARYGDSLGVCFGGAA